MEVAIFLVLVIGAAYLLMNIFAKKDRVQQAKAQPKIAPEPLKDWDRSKTSSIATLTNARDIVAKYKKNPLDDFYDANRDDWMERFNGKRWGQIVGENVPETLVDGEEPPYWIQHKEGKHDLDLMLRCCEAQLYYAIVGDVPAPAYFLRVAIIYSKQKQFEKEIQICEFYLRLIGEFESQGGTKAGPAGYASPRVVKQIKDRIPKAHAKLQKQQEKNKAG